MEQILVLTSITYAMKAKELLEQERIPSSLTRESAIKRIRSCGYGVRVRQGDASRAEALLRQADIRILGSVPVKETERSGREA